jgi:CRP-like cAMP-binding protein
MAADDDTLGDPPAEWEPPCVGPEQRIGRDQAHATPGPMSAYEPLLRRSPLFSALDDHQLAQVKQTLRHIALAENETLFVHQQHADRFFMLLRGQVKLFRISPNGDEKVVELVQPGQTFAEAVMFMETHRYPVSATAIVASELLSVDSHTFLNQLRHSTETCFRLMADMSMRLRARLREIDDLTLQNATFRLVNFLVQQLPKDASGESTIQLQTPKSVIASRLSIKPETFSRILSSLCKDGIIEVERSTVHVHDIARLRDYGG